MRTTLPAEERVTPIYVVENVTTALGIASAGLAVTLAPAYVSAFADRMGLVMLRVVNAEIVREVTIYAPTDRSMSPAAEGFLEFLERWLQEWSQQI